MALNLSQICTRALDEISSFNVPTFFVGNEDPTAKTLVASALKVGEELVRDYDWQECNRTATITTVDSTSLYDLEDDYDRIASDTMWNGTESRRMHGNATKRQWAALTNLSISTTTRYQWRLYRNQIQIEPAAVGVFSFNYEYLSKVYCLDADGADRLEGWQNDTDTPLLPADIFIAGVRYYFADSKNLPGALRFAAEYDAIIQSRHGKNTPSQAVNMAANVRRPGRGYRPRLNIPDMVDV